MLFILAAPAFYNAARGKCMIFDLSTLQEATENFSEENKLGEGGFGTVYKVTNKPRCNMHNGVLIIF